MGLSKIERSLDRSLKFIPKILSLEKIQIEILPSLFDKPSVTSTEISFMLKLGRLVSETTVIE